jgi:hypothetical protein
MESNSKYQFKHPIPSQGKPVTELNWIAKEDLLQAAEPQTGLRLVVWRGLKLIVRQMIGLDEMQDLVGKVVCGCWDGEEYRHEAMDFELRRAVILFFTNVEMPDEMEKQYEYLYGTDLYETAVQSISQSQIAAIREAVRMYLSK